MKPMPLALAAVMSLLVPALAEKEPDPVAIERTLEDFSSAEAEKTWRVVTDGVMGGISRGSVRVDGGRLRFTGETRLENNGGFSSIRSRPRDWGLGGSRELVVRMKGTPTRGYTMLLRTGERSRGRTVSYWQPFKLKGEGWQTVRLPLDEFFPNWRGRRLRGPELDAEKVTTLGLMVNDEKAAPFTVEIDWIKARRGEAPTPAAAQTTKSAPTIAAIAAGDARFSTLLAAAKAAGLAETLASPGPFTVFAPTNEAFARLPEGTLQSLLEPRNKERLRAILLHHVVAGKRSGNALVAGRRFETVQGETLAVGLEKGRLMAGEARVIANDVAAANGVVHVIDTVLIPRELPASDPAVALIERAVEKGSQLFNAGQVEACAVIYELTATALLDLEAKNLDAASREALRTAVKRTRGSDDHRSSAWTLRRALNVAWSDLKR